MSNGLINRQYVGARYVPKIMGEWNKALQYEALSVVTYMGNSFTSKVPVPANIEINNENYWINTGNYNAQVENYRNDVKKLDNKIDRIYDELKYYVTPEMFGAVGDGIHDDTNAFEKMILTKNDIYLSKKYKVTHITINGDINFIGSNGTVINAGCIEVLGKSKFENITFIGNATYPYANIADSASSEKNQRSIFLIGYQTPFYENSTENRNAIAEFNNCVFDFDNDCYSNNLFNLYTITVKAHNVKNIFMSNCKIFKSGIEIRYCDSFNIENCLFDGENFDYNNNSESIHSTRDSSGTIKNCHFTNCNQDFIDLYPSSHDVVIDSNTFVKKSTNSTSLMITLKTQFRDSDYASATNFRTSGIKNITITNNNFKDSANNGLYFDFNCYDERITNTDNVTAFLPENINVSNNIFNANTSELRIINHRGGFKNFRFSNNIINCGNNTKANIMFPLQKADNLKTDFIGSNYSFVDNIINSTSGITRDCIYYLNVNGIESKNIFNLGAGRQTITVACVVVNNCKEALLNDTVFGDLPQGHDTYYYYGNNLETSNCLKDGVIRRMYEYTDRFKINSGGYSCNEGFVYINVVGTSNYASGGLSTFMLNNIESSLDEMLLTCYDVTTKTFLPCIIKNGNNQGNIQIDTTGTNSGDVLKISGFYPMKYGTSI